MLAGLAVGVVGSGVYALGHHDEPDAAYAYMAFFGLGAMIAIPGAIVGASGLAAMAAYDSDLELPRGPTPPDPNAPALSMPADEAVTE